MHHFGTTRTPLHRLCHRNCRCATRHTAATTARPPAKHARRQPRARRRVATTAACDRPDAGRNGLAIGIAVALFGIGGGSAALAADADHDPQGVRGGPGSSPDHRYGVDTERRNALRANPRGPVGGPGIGPNPVRWGKPPGHAAGLAPIGRIRPEHAASAGPPSVTASACRPALATPPTACGDGIAASAALQRADQSSECRATTSTTCGGHSRRLPQTRRSAT